MPPGSECGPRHRLPDAAGADDSHEAAID